MNAEKPKDAGCFPLEWASDAIADLIGALGFEYIALNPGASFRGLHDSVVNYLGNENPQILLMLHEEHAVSIAHGYAKLTGKPMAVIVHSNVGLMHATMPVFNAWCDRVPIVILGATGPVDAARRRPWIDWIHTSLDQGALIRDYTKWDDQPASVRAALESLLRANLLCRTAPCGPVYICFDMDLLEEKLDEKTDIPNVSRFLQAAPPHSSPSSISQAMKILSHANNPLILIGRTNRSKSGWDDRIRLAEVLGAKVLTDLKVGAGFPSEHPLNIVAPGEFLSPKTAALIRDSDAILSLDWVDLGGTLKRVWGTESVSAKVIQCSLDSYSHRAWSMDYQALPPVDLFSLSDTDTFVSDLLDEVEESRSSEKIKKGVETQSMDKFVQPVPFDEKADNKRGSIGFRDLAVSLNRIMSDRKTTIIRVPIGWPGDLLHLRDPLDFLGNDGCAGLGAGPGIAVGASLALKDSGRIPIAILGDGDFLMGVTALWTAARYSIPLLIIVVNNRSFGNSEGHQKMIAKQRGRHSENNWIGTRIDDPAVDLSKIARAQGLKAGGPFADMSELPEALSTAVKEVEKGSGYVLDILVE